MKQVINKNWLRIKLSEENFIALFVCIYLFISTNPYILWLIPSFLIYLPTLFVLFVTFFLLWYNGKIIITKRLLFLSILFIFFSSYMALPIFWSGHHLFKILNFAPFFLFVLFLTNNTVYKSFIFFRNLLLFFSFASIVLFILLLFNIDAPHIVVDGFTIPMQYKNDFYRVYFFAVSSTNTVYNIAGFTIARACGAFAEPGHFGIYLGFVLAIEKLLFNKLSKLLIIAGFLTFSPAFYIIGFFIILYDVFLNRKFKPLFIITTILIVFSSILLSNRNLRDGILFLIWNRNFAEGRSIFDDRARDYTINAYNQFTKTTNFLTGKGVEHLNRIGVLSDPRGFIFKFGLIGIVLSIIILIILFSMGKKRFLFIILPIVILIFSHRSWMFESPYIYLLIFLGTTSLNYVEASRITNNHDDFQLIKT